MTNQNYSVNQYLVSNLLSLVQIKEIAIPEIQRPFVWEPDKVTELIDSLYDSDRRPAAYYCFAGGNSWRDREEP